MLLTCEASVWIFYAEFLHATFFQFLQCECFMRAEVRRGSKVVFMPLSGLQIRGGYCHYQDCKSGVGIVTIRIANQGWVLSSSGLLNRGGYCHYQDCESGVCIVHVGKLEGVLFGRAIFSRWIEDVKRGVRVKTGEWKEVQMSRIWNWRQAPGSFVFCAPRKSFVYIFWWLLHHAMERGVVLSVTQQTLVVLYMDLAIIWYVDNGQKNLIFISFCN